MAITHLSRLTGKAVLFLGTRRAGKGTCCIDVVDNDGVRKATGRFDGPISVFQMEKTQRPALKLGEDVFIPLQIVQPLMSDGADFEITDAKSIDQLLKLAIAAAGS